MTINLKGAGENGLKLKQHSEMTFGQLGDGFHLDKDQQNKKNKT